jgi:hypothetical protein
MGVPHNLRAGRQPTTIGDPLRRALDAGPSLLRTAWQDGNLDFFPQRRLEYLNVPLQELRSPNSVTQQSNPEIVLSASGFTMKRPD